MSHRWSFCLVLVLGAAVSAQESTWDIIRHDILSANCANCHTAGTSFARQSDLILTPDEAYRELVDVPPRNDAAREDGLLRVSSAGQLPGIEQSYLWEKINVVQQDHLHDDHPEYGALMPLGTDPLTNGELSFIEQWMLEGAPETGVVADIALLEDTSMYAPHTFEPLPVPQNGIQLHVGPFDVWPAERYDREIYYFEPVRADEPMYVNKYEVRYREGSHHFILDHYQQRDRRAAGRRPRWPRAWWRWPMPATAAARSASRPPAAACSG